MEVFADKLQKSKLEIILKTKITQHVFQWQIQSSEDRQHLRHGTPRDFVAICAPFSVVYAALRYRCQRNSEIMFIVTKQLSGCSLCPTCAAEFQWIESFSESHQDIIGED